MNEVYPTPRPIMWDDISILKALGWSPAAVRRNLIKEKQGTPTEPTDWAIYMWASRGKISSAWRPRLLYTALRLDRMNMIDAFKLVDAPPTARPRKNENHDNEPDLFDPPPPTPDATPGEDG